MARSLFLRSLVSLLTLAILPSPAAAWTSSTVCAVNEDGTRISRWNGGGWDQIGSAGDFAGGRVGTIYGGGYALVATNRDNNQVYAWENGARYWHNIGGGGLKFAADRYSIYGLSGKGNSDGVYKYTGSGREWQRLGGGGSNIWAGGSGHLFAVNPQNTEIFKWRTGENWESAGSGGTDFAVDGDGILYGLSDNREAVYCRNWNGAFYEWQQIGNSASRLFAGGYTGVFAVTLHNTEIWKWDRSSRTWTKVGGGGKDFAVSDEGLYGLPGDGSRVYKWQYGEQWQDLGSPGGGVIKQIVPCP